jgi:AAA domain
MTRRARVSGELTPREIAERLNCGDLKVGESQRVAAPYRDDENPSLNVTRTARSFKFCDFGIDYSEGRTLAALRKHFSVNGARALAKQTDRARRRTSILEFEDVSPLDWWDEYTGVSRDEWERLGCDEDGRYVVFEFDGLDAAKIREKGTKNFQWQGLDGSPLLWPLPEDHVPSVVVLTEGESDCGVLRHCGYHAFAVTKGAAGLGEIVEVLRELKRRGAEEVRVVPDTDAPSFRASVVEGAALVRLACSYVDLSPYCDVTRGENDARAVFLRYGRDVLTRILEEERIGIEQRPDSDSLEDVLGWAEEDEDWLVEPLIARGTKTLIAGPAKSLKTYFILDVVATCATGCDLLDVPRYRVPQPLRVLVVEEEGSRPMFGRRVRRVLNGIPGDLQAQPRFWFRRGFNLVNDADVTRLIAQMRDDEIDLLILDPLQRITPGVDENSNSDMRRVWDAANRIIIELPHVAVIVVHHTRKGDALSPESSRGAGSMLGEYDLGIFIQKNDDFTKTETSYRGTLALTLDGRELPQEYTKDGGAMEVEYEFDYARDAFTMRATGDVLHVNVRRASKIPEFLAMYLQNAQEFVPTADLFTEAQRLGLNVSSREAILKHLRTLHDQGRVVAEVRPEFHGAKAWKWASA